MTEPRIPSEIQKLVQKLIREELERFQVQSKFEGIIRDSRISRGHSERLKGICDAEGRSRMIELTEMDEGSAASFVVEEAPSPFVEEEQKGDTDMSSREFPTWKADLGFYAPDELVGVTFESSDDFQRVLEFIWKKGHPLWRMPFDFGDKNTLIAPLAILEVLERERISSVSNPVLDPESLSADERKELYDEFKTLGDQDAR